jgi:hypothetical protein
MTQPSFRPDDRPARQEERDEQLTPPSNSLPDRSLLEQVLLETVAAVGEDAGIDESCMQAMRDVARRHRGSALSHDPVAVDLIAAVLRHCFRTRDVSADFWASVSHQIAESLMEDPVARNRLERLWTRLTEAV